MAQIFSSNQVSQVLVAESNSDTTLTNASSLGAIKADKTSDGKYLYFTHMGKGGITRSDLIEVASVMNVKAVVAKTMFRNLKYSLIQLNPDAHTTTTLGGSYVLNFEFMNPIGMSPDNKYFKHAAVNTTATMTASDFYGKLAKSIAQNMARENVKLITPAAFFVGPYNTTTGASANDVVIEGGIIYVATGTNSGAFDPTGNWKKVNMVTPAAFSTTPAYSRGDIVEYQGAVYVANQSHSAGAWNASHFTKIYQEVDTNTTLSGTATGVLVMEAPQDNWRLGHIQDRALVWNTSFSPVTANNDEYPWGVETLMTGAPLTNSKKAAEFEYFAMGERADQYRGAGWPNNIDTEYMVNPAAANGYDMICIHYAYTGSNHAVQKSEKDLVIITPGNSTVGSLGRVAKAIKDAVNDLFANLID